jgi:EAL domain-containing protein (putative c-di-GMP-specific phosphodiesterase class I)
VARLGGDEFVIIQTHLAQPKAAGVLTQKLIKELSRTYLLDGQEIHSSASIGVAVYPKDAKDPVQLLKNADIAMYQAKVQGRYNYVFYKEEMRTQANSRKSLGENLRRALEKKEFILHYQPQIDLSSWKVTGVEALLRWQCPQLQMLPPAEFINLAEETGLIIPIGEWVLRTACLQNKIWQKAGISPFRIGVNLSARQFKNAKFVETVGRALKDASLDPAYLELEITERLLMESTHSNSAILASLKTIGVHISIDDFGTGFSALSYLKHFPIDVLKIDQAITQHLPHNRYDTAITSAIISLAQALGIRVIAESVETVEQLAFLKKQGCTSIQGFLCSPPVTAGELEKLLREGYWSRVNPS